MSAFHGKWVDDDTVERTNFDEMLKKMEMPEEMTEKYRKSKTTLVYSCDGNNVNCKVMSTAFPDEVKDYSFRSGEPFDDVGLDGTTFKATITLEGEKKMTESGTSGKWGPFSTTREVNGNIMIVKQTYAGITMTYQMKRQ